MEAERPRIDFFLMKGWITCLEGKIYVVHNTPAPRKGVKV